MITTSTLASSAVKSAGGETGKVHEARVFGESTPASGAFRLGQPSTAMDPALSFTQNGEHSTGESQQDDTQQDILTLLLSGLTSAATPERNPLHSSAPANERLGQMKIHGEHAAVNQHRADTAVTAQTSELRQSHTQTAASVSELPSQVKLTSLSNDVLSSGSSQPLAQPLMAGAASAQSHTLQSAATTAASATSTPQTAEWASMRIDTQAGRWGEQMMQVLHDRVSLQAQQNLQEAKIRLDPPELGKLDLLVRVEGDRLSVHINANASATREALMQVSERLRAELQDQNFVHVDVNVGSDQDDQASPYSPTDEQATIFAARDLREDNSHTFTSDHWLNTQA